MTITKHQTRGVRLEKAVNEFHQYLHYRYRFAPAKSSQGSPYSHILYCPGQMAREIVDSKEQGDLTLLALEEKHAVRIYTYDHFTSDRGRVVLGIRIEARSLTVVEKNRSEG